MGLIVLSPLFLVLAVLISLDGGPAFYSQSRVGRNGRPIRGLKLRTMYGDAEERLERVLASDPDLREHWQRYFKLAKDPRILPRVGSLMRRASLDELPQLFNVLRGDMSIVGPRPVTEEELGRYSDSTNAYYACRPGITGLWQVSGRSATTFQRRVVLDSYYAHHWSMVLDAKIILATVPAVCFSDTAY